MKVLILKVNLSDEYENIFLFKSTCSIYVPNIWILQHL
jgi:hypothetical protein